VRRCRVETAKTRPSTWLSEPLTLKERLCPSADRPGYFQVLRRLPESVRLHEVTSSRPGVPRTRHEHAMQD
jgi:hypothetical protein